MTGVAENLAAMKGGWSENLQGPRSTAGDLVVAGNAISGSGPPEKPDKERYKAVTME
jgi:hypothetical protein